jgi:signal transduction histidine kinase
MSEPASPHNEPAPEVNRPRHALERRIVLWTLAMVIVPTFLCALWLNYCARRAWELTQARDVVLVAQTAATALAGRLGTASREQARAVVEGLLLDKRVAFVLVTGPESELMHLRVADRPAWADYCAGRSAANAPPMDRPLTLGEARDVAVWRAPIWDEPRARPPRGAGDEKPQEAGGERRQDGFVVNGQREWHAAAMVAQLEAAELFAAGALCLVALPIVVLAVRRWTRPLRDLLAATRRLAEGGAPAPIAAGSRDELGQLAAGFNDMAGKLSAARGELQRANADLESKVRARTGELERAKRDLEQEITEKNEFLRAVSHDLGAPLRNIGGMAAMLLMKYRATLADDACNKLERIHANVKAQTDLINDLMEISRIRTKPGKRQRVDLHALVQELVESMAYDLDRERITLEVRGRLPVVVAERTRIRQVFQNLIDNAVKYMLDASERRIIVSSREDGEGWRFSVADTGRGIAADDLPRVFQLYRRATHSGSHHVPGRGVGLASVRAVVETYGGRIWVESKLGAGSTFHFTMPRADDPSRQGGLSPPALEILEPPARA